MLRWRLLAAAAILGPLFGLIWLDDQFHGGRPGIWLGPFAVLVSLLATHELNQFWQRGSLPCSSTVNLFAVACVTVMSLGPLIWSSYPGEALLEPLGWTVTGLCLALAVLFNAEIARYEKPGESVLRVACGSLVVLYVGLGMGLLIQLRLLPSGRRGLLALIATILIVKLSDVGAYFVGRAIGRTRLTRVSPGKTLEGLGGGLIFALLAAWAVRDLVFPYFAPDTPVGGRGAFLLYGAMLMAAGLLGDLAESLLKRDVQQKDSSHWMPGLGGVMDVIDSLLAAAPVSYFWWSSGLL